MHSAAHLDKLRERIELLEKHVKEQDAKIARVVKVHALMIEHLTTHDREIVDTFARLGNIELELFPGLARDLDSVDKIIGDTDGKANPLDKKPD